MIINNQWLNIFLGLGRRTKLLHWPTIPPYENEGVIECFPSVISDDIQHVGFGI